MMQFNGGKDARSDVVVGALVDGGSVEFITIRSAGEGGRGDGDVC